MERYRFHADPEDIKASSVNDSHTARTYIKEGPVTLSAGLQSQERYLFLFNDLLMIAKEKSAKSYKLKEKVRLSELWLTLECIEDVSESARSPTTSFVIGWPTMNYVAEFRNPLERDSWYETLARLVDCQKIRDYPKVTTLRVHYKHIKNDSVAFLTHNYQTALEVLRIALACLDIHEPETQYQLWVTSGKENAPYPLYGHEIPFAILISHLRDLLHSDAGFELPSLSDLESLATNNIYSLLKCHFVLKPKRNAKKGGLIKKRHQGANIVSQIKRKMMVKSDSVDSALSPSPPLSESSPGKLFGQSLVNLCPDGKFPHAIKALLEHVMTEGLYCEGIFRKTGKHSVIRDLRERLDAGEDVSFRKCHPIVTAALIKEFLRSLPDCLLVSGKFDAWMKLVDVPQEKRIEAAKQLIAELPAAHVELLKHLLCLLHHVANQESANQMGAGNLGISFGYTNLSPPHMEKNVQETSKRVPYITQFLINNVVELFGPDTVKLLGPVPDRISPAHDSSEESDSLGLRQQHDTSSMDSLVGGVSTNGSRPESSLRARPPQTSSHDSGLADPHFLLSTDESEVSVKRFSHSPDEEDDIDDGPDRRLSASSPADESSSAASAVSYSNGTRRASTDNYLSLKIDKTIHGLPKTDLPKPNTVSLERRPPVSGRRNSWLANPGASADISGLLSSVDSLYTSTESTASSNVVEFRRSNPLTSSKKKLHRGTLLRSDSGEHLHISESVILPPSEDNCSRVSITTDGGAVSPLSLSGASDPLSPDSSSMLSSPAVSPRTPELVRNTPARKPARHRKGPAPLPPGDNVDSSKQTDFLSLSPHNLVQFRQNTSNFLSSPCAAIRPISLPGNLPSADSSTVTESSNESTPQVSRESSRAKDYAQTASQMFPRDETLSIVVDDDLDPPFPAPSTLTSQNCVSSGFNHRPVEPKPAMVPVTHTLVTAASCSPLVVDSNPVYVPRSPLYGSETPTTPRTIPRLPSYEEAVRLKRQGNVSSRSESALSTKSPLTLDRRSVEPTDCRPETQTPVTSQTQCTPQDGHKLTITVCPSGKVRDRIRRYDREGLRRKTLGGAEFLQSVKSAPPEPAGAPAPAPAASHRTLKRTSSEETLPSLSVAGDTPLSRQQKNTSPTLSTEISWSVQKLKNFYDSRHVGEAKNVPSYNSPYNSTSSLVGRPLWPRERRYVQHQFEPIQTSRPAVPASVYYGRLHQSSINSRETSPALNGNYPVIKPPPLSASQAKPLRIAGAYPPGDRERSPSWLSERRPRRSCSVNPYLSQRSLDEDNSRTTISYV